MVKKYDWYPAEDKLAKSIKRHTPKAPKLRSSIKPGSVLILLSGRFRGKRVVFLKSLKSGLLAVTGPYKINGVPIKRVNQVYTVTTSTIVDLKGVALDSITDETFTKDKKAVLAKGAKKFFAEAAPKVTTSDARKKLQKDVDDKLMAVLKKDKIMPKYLNARFSLVKNDAPHLMKF